MFEVAVGLELILGVFIEAADFWTKWVRKRPPGGE